MKSLGNVQIQNNSKAVDLFSLNFFSIKVEKNLKLNKNIQKIQILKTTYFPFKILKMKAKYKIK